MIAALIISWLSIILLLSILWFICQELEISKINRDRFKTLFRRSKIENDALVSRIRQMESEPSQVKVKKLIERINYLENGGKDAK